MSENHLKINRRQFLVKAGTGALAIMLAPGMLAAAGRNVAPVEPGNPLFTGALGRYEGVNIIHSPGDGLGPMRELYHAGSTVKEVSVNIDGEDFVTIHEKWIPINKIIRRG